MKPKWYRATVMHDTGKLNISVCASTKARAINMICEAEGCPPCAVLYIRRV